MTNSSNLPRNWELHSLDSLIQIVMGQAPPGSECNKDGFGTVFVKAGEFGALKPRVREWTSNPLRYAQEGDVLLCVVGATCGKLNLGIDCAIGRSVAALRPLVVLDQKFLYYFLSTRILHLRGNSTGSAQGVISKDDISSIEFPTAPLNEQKRIVSKIEELFSELDKGIENLNAAREQLNAYRQAVIKHAFEGKLTAGWREENQATLESSPDRLLSVVKEEREAHYKRQLEDWTTAVIGWEKSSKRGPKPRKPAAYKQPKAINAREVELLPAISRSWRYVRLSVVASIGSGMAVSASRDPADPIEVPYLRVANVQRGFLELDEIKSMRIERTQLPSLKLKHWDVLFNEGGDRDKLGRGWIWQSEVEPCITQNHVFRASLYIPTEHGAKLLSHWGNTFGQRYFEETGKQTTNLASINKTVLSEFPVPLIPHQEQEEICRQIDRLMTIIDAQEREIENALKRSELIRQSILKRAYAGELVAQDPNDEPASVLLERIKAEEDAEAQKAKAGKASTKTSKKKTAKRAAKRRDAA